MGIDLHSVRESSGEVRLAIPAEDLLRNLFGSRFDGIHGINLDVKKWKKICNRLIETLESCIYLNLDTDIIHIEEINRYLLIAKGSIDTNKNADPGILLALFGLCFELLGSPPDNRKKLIVNKHPNNYYTGTFRTINYSTSPTQKMKIIMKSAYFDEFRKYYSLEDLDNLYEGNSRSFIKAFKEKYPEAYAKIF